MVAKAIEYAIKWHLKFQFNELAKEIEQSLASEDFTSDSREHRISRKLIKVIRDRADKIIL